MSTTLSIGEHIGVIKRTGVVVDSQDRDIVEIDVEVGGHDEPVTVSFRLYGNAEKISMDSISKLGFRGTLHQLFEDKSGLNGMRVTLVAKQGAPRANGGFWTNYSILPLRKATPSKVRDLKFGEPSANGGSW